MNKLYHVITLPNFIVLSFVSYFIILVYFTASKMTEEDWQVECSDDDCADDYKPSSDKIIEWLERVCGGEEVTPIFIII